jgi:cytochrome oxidase Cu insertion factor (SCO1/SenC/PrrC family)
MSRRTESADRPRPTRVPTRSARLRATGRSGPGSGGRANTAVLGIVALATIALVITAILVLRPSAIGAPAGAVGASAAGPAVGTAVGDQAPDFRLVDIGGKTVTRDSLRGRPAVVWFTASYCTPCQEGARALQRVLDRIGPTSSRVAIVIVFVDPGDPPAALADWKAQFGRADWTAALAAGSIIRDYRVQYLDTKYLLDANGVIRTADFTPLQQGSWERDLRAVLGG